MSSNNTAEERQHRTPRMADVPELGCFPDDFDHDSESRREERKRLRDWSKASKASPMEMDSPSIIGKNHMNLEAFTIRYLVTYNYIDR